MVSGGDVVLFEMSIIQEDAFGVVRIVRVTDVRSIIGVITSDGEDEFPSWIISTEENIDESRPVFGTRQTCPKYAGNVGIETLFTMTIVEAQRDATVCTNSSPSWNEERFSRSRPSDDQALMKTRHRPPKKSSLLKAVLMVV